MYFMSNRFLKDNINGVYVTQFQLPYIRDTTHPSHKIWLSFFVKTLYIVVKSRVGTIGVGGLHKVKYINNQSYYYVISAQ